MGCCELRSDEYTNLEYEAGIRKSKNSRRSSNKRVSFSKTQPGELRHSLAKLVPSLEEDSEPELYSRIKHSETLILANSWIHSYEKDWTQIKYLTDFNGSLLIYVQLSISAVCSVENILNVLNDPELRILWDIDLSSVQIIDGHRVLDAKLSVLKKGQDYKELDRYVRYYREQVAIIEVAQNWNLTGLVISEAESTIIELVMTAPTGNVENELKKKKLWAARLYQEILKEE